MCREYNRSLNIKWKQLSILAIYSLEPDLPGTPAGSTVFYFLRSPFSGAVLSFRLRPWVPDRGTVVLREDTKDSLV